MSASSTELNIRENFKKDYKLSCPVIDDSEIFKKSLKIFNLEQEWEDYHNMALRYNDFDGYRKVLRSKIVKAIEAVDGYANLMPINNPYGQLSNGQLSNGQLSNGQLSTYPNSYLRSDIVGKKLISLDLVKGNFQSLRYLGKQYTLGYEKYEEFIKKFTNEPSLINSKYFRQMIFGLLKPNVQASVQQMMVSHMIQLVKTAIDLPVEYVSNDEVMFSYTTEEQADIVDKLVQDNKIPYEIKVKLLSINSIDNWYDESWFYSTVTKPTIQRRILSVHVKYLFQVYNHLEKITNDEKDFLWRERGRLCKLLEPERFEKNPNAVNPNPNPNH